MGASAALVAWTLLLGTASRRSGRTLALTFAPRAQHYLQACAQASVYAYWGWYWRPVYDAVPLIAAQIVFAYAFDVLLSWSRRDTYTLGFGPFPVVFSTNLFLWFKPDWFYLQFLMVAVGFAAKDLIRWSRAGRDAHIFNPSSFTLALFSLALIATGTSDRTWGQEIAITQFYPPHMYLMLFLVGLPGQFLFGVTTMTMSAVVSTYVFGLAFFAVTGHYYFYDSYVPIAVFLGMHLLFTDPSTSPRSELGRVIFGVLYGLSSVALYQLLGMMGVPTFYDKLLQVPLLNLSVKAIERVAESPILRGLDPARLAVAWSGRRRHLAFITVWAVTFGLMSAVQGVGDDHRGQWLPFWEQACAADRPGQARACAYLNGLKGLYCEAGSGWACNEVALAQAADGGPAGGGPRLSPVEIGDVFAQGCQLGFEVACANERAWRGGSRALAEGPPQLADYPIVARGTKAPIAHLSPQELAARACRQGWSAACGQTIPAN